MGPESVQGCGIGVENVNAGVAATPPDLATVAGARQLAARQSAYSGVSGDDAVVVGMGSRCARGPAADDVDRYGISVDECLDPAHLMSREAGVALLRIHRPIGTTPVGPAVRTPPHRCP
jgi:hypothetical protein